jgi:hypothetical protein
MKITSPNISILDTPLQIRIGVTGHRNIVLTEELKKSVDTVLTESIQKIINPQKKKIVTPISYKVVTPLADGADRIVAVEAMQVLNAEMEVILPMMEDEYKETFYDEKSQEEFKKLLEKAKSVTLLITKPLFEEFPGKNLLECKNMAYRNVGIAVIENCDILIALWDGIMNNKAGGTSEVVNEARMRKKTLIIISSISPYEVGIERGKDFSRNYLD